MGFFPSGFSNKGTYLVSLARLIPNINCPWGRGGVYHLPSTKNLGKFNVAV
jgi:hypothetical protein